MMEALYPVELATDRTAANGTFIVRRQIPGETTDGFLST